MGSNCRPVPAQVFRLKAEGHETCRKPRIKPFNTFSVSTSVGSIRDESSLGKEPNRFETFKGWPLKAFSLQSIYLSRAAFHAGRKTHDACPVSWYTAVPCPFRLPGRGSDRLLSFNRLLQNTHQAVNQGNISSRLKGKDPCSAFSYELYASKCENSCRHFRGKKNSMTRSAPPWRTPMDPCSSSPGRAAGRPAP